MNTRGVDQVEAFQERRRSLLPAGMSAPVTAIDRARGSKVFDLNGREYIDFISGIGVMAIGHTHDAVGKAVKAQVDRFSHTCFGIVGYTPYLDLAEKLVALYPHRGGTKVFLTNSGSDSVENAVKIARAYTRRSGIVAFSHAFHGRHYMGMTLTDKPSNRKFCGPLPGEVYRLRFPSYFHYGYRENYRDYLKQEIAALEDFFKTRVNPEEMAAVILELVQGEGGFLVMPPEYLQALQDICKRHQILIIVDEVQSGFGRTGKWAAYQHYPDFVPDLSVWAKAMGSGYPLGAVMGAQEIMDGIPPGILGGTYLGNPVACAAGHATITCMEEIDLPRLAAERGEVIAKKLSHLHEEFDIVAQVRGLGAMRAVEFCEKRNPRKPSSQFCKDLIARCREAGLLLIGAGPRSNVIRILCPLNIEMEVLEEGLEIMERELKSLTEAKHV